MKTIPYVNLAHIPSGICEIVSSGYYASFPDDDASHRHFPCIPRILCLGFIIR